MSQNLLEVFNKSVAGPGAPNFSVGDTVKVHWKIKEVPVEKRLSKTAKAIKKSKEEGPKTLERVQVFEGVVIARKHGFGASATFTVRKIASGNIGVERTFPLHSPLIQKLEVVRSAKVRRAKLYYLRGLTGRKAKMKERKKFAELIQEEAQEAPATEVATAVAEK